MSVREQAIAFDCNGEQLIGVLSLPQRSNGIGVVIVVGGPQYRAGSHRQFVLLARALATQGHTVLRFDYRGMGDSAGEARDFLQVNADLDAAIGTLRTTCPAVQRVVFWGLCDGASAILLFLGARRGNHAVDGAVLLNPWVRSAASLASTQVKHYYLQRLVQRQFWAKVLHGRLSLGALRDFGQALTTALKSRMASKSNAQSGSFQDRMAAAWRDCNVPLLVILSGQDYVAKEFTGHASCSPAWQGLLSRSDVSVCEFAQADHTFSNAAARQLVEHETARWLSEHVATPNTRPRART